MSAQQLVGAGGTSLGALTSIGSDLSVSVSFQVASELLDSAHETDMREDELVGIVLGVAIALLALKKLLGYARDERRRLQLNEVEAVASKHTFDRLEQIRDGSKLPMLTPLEQRTVFNLACKLMSETKAVKLSELETGAEFGKIVELFKTSAVRRLSSEKSLLDFALLFASIATRIAFAVTVQLLAASARARQTSREARILSLMGLAVFFVFVESSADRRIF